MSPADSGIHRNAVRRNSSSSKKELHRDVEQTSDRSSASRLPGSVSPSPDTNTLKICVSRVNPMTLLHIFQTTGGKLSQNPLHLPATMYVGGAGSLVRDQKSLAAVRVCGGSTCPFQLFGPGWHPTDKHLKDSKCVQTSHKVDGEAIGHALLEASVAEFRV